MRNLIPKILALAGFTAVSTGLWLWSHIAALIIGGLILCVASIVLMARNLLARHYTAAVEKQQAIVKRAEDIERDRGGNTPEGIRSAIEYLDKKAEEVTRIRRVKCCS